MKVLLSKVGVSEEYCVPKDQDTIDGMENEDDTFDYSDTDDDDLEWSELIFVRCCPYFLIIFLQEMS